MTKGLCNNYGIYLTLLLRIFIESGGLARL